MINFNGGQYLLNGRDLWLDFGFVATGGKDGFLSLPKRKDPYSYNWPDENGTQWDLASPVFEDPVITIDGYMVSFTRNEFLNKRYDLFNELIKAGESILYIPDLDETFKVFYTDQPVSEFKYHKLSDSGMKAWKVSFAFQTIDFINSNHNPGINVLSVNINNILTDGNFNILKTD